MNSKEYVMPDGRKAVFEYDHYGIGKVTIEAMDMLMGLIADGRKRGEWIDDGLDAIGVMGVEYRWHKCSQCGFRISKSPSAYYPNFCEACGARMKGADDE